MYIYENKAKEKLLMGGHSQKATLEATKNQNLS